MIVIIIIVIITIIFFAILHDPLQCHINMSDLDWPRCFIPWLILCVYIYICICTKILYVHRWSRVCIYIKLHALHISSDFEGSDADSTPFCWSTQLNPRANSSVEVLWGWQSPRFLMVGGVIHVYLYAFPRKIVGWFVFPCSGMAQPASLGKPQNSRWTPEKNMIKYDNCVHILWQVSVFLGLKWLVSGNICGWLFKASSAPSWDSHWCCTLAIASSEWSNHWSRDDNLAYYQWLFCDSIWFDYNEKPYDIWLI